ncbi:hypothetical protein B0O99DRAFT_637695 [Bisporella sp. PMI_857]|nr:hypothetical protein B0O99DRAFT_637695 [Bisporella sp. PMI_857]
MKAWENIKGLGKRLKAKLHISKKTADDGEPSQPSNEPPGSSTLGSNDPGSHISSRAQDKSGQALAVGSLWIKAADKLDSEDRKKLDALVPPKSKAQPDTAGDKAPEGVSIIISMANNLKEENKNATWKPIINKIIDGAMKFKSLGDAAVKFDKSGYAALGWSIVSFGLEVAANAQKAREFVMESSEVITNFMLRYARYEVEFTLPPTDEDLEDLITDVYKAILLFSIALDGYLKQCAAEHAGRAVYDLDDRTISKKKKAIDSADDNVQKWLPSVQSKRNKELVDQIMEKIDNCMKPNYDVSERLLCVLSKEDSTTLDWLPDIGGEVSAHIEIKNKIRDVLWPKNRQEKRQPGEWLRESDRFKEWQNAKVSCGLWLKGALGTGKTVLTSTVIDHMTHLYGNVTQGAFAYHYCSGTASTNQKSSNILGGLLRQLAETTEGLTIFQKWKQNHKQHELTNEEIEVLLSDMIRINGSTQTTIIIDALDEIDRETFSQVVEVLENLIDGGSGLVKVFVSSRPEHYIESALRSWARIEVEKKLTAPDMEAYINNQVHKKLILDTEFDELVQDSLEKDVIKYLRAKAEGMFRYVEMAITWICEPTKPLYVCRAMNKIPPMLDGIYAELFQRIDDDHDHPERQELARRAISWLLGAHVQLSANEFIKAISAAYEDYNYKVTINDVLSSCHHLVTYDTQADTFTIGHFSVTEYIQEHRKEDYGQSRIHNTIAYLCLNAMWQSARINYQGFESESILKYVRSLTVKPLPDIHGGENSGISIHSVNEPMSKSFFNEPTFWSYATNVWPAHCEAGGADSGNPNEWDEILEAWCDINRSTGKVPITEFVYFGSIQRRVLKIGLVNDFNSWIFLVSCAFGLHTMLRKLLDDSPYLAEGDDGASLAVEYRHANCAALLHMSKPGFWEEVLESMG